MKLKELTQEEFLNLIREDVEQAGGQQEVAERIGVTQSYLSQVLNGRKSISASILRGYNATANVSYSVEKKKEKK